MLTHKQKLLYIPVFILTLITCIFSISTIIRIEEREARLTKYLGDTIYIDGNVKTIVDYSIFEDSYFLSDGTEVSYSLVLKSK